MPQNVNRMDLHERLQSDREVLLERAKRIGRELAIPNEAKGLIGTSGASSALPGSIRHDVTQAMLSVADSFVSPRALGDEIRRLVKSVYGDGFDAAVTNSCEASRWLGLPTAHGARRTRLPLTLRLWGGMQQRVALALSWIVESELALIDKPSGAPDAQRRVAVQEMLFEVWERLRTTVLFITQALLRNVRAPGPGRIVENIAFDLPRLRRYET